MKRFFKFVFRWLYAVELADVKAVAAQAEAIRPVERPFTIKTFDPDGMEYLAGIHVMANDPVVQFFFTFQREQFVSVFGKIGEGGKVSDPAIINQVYGRICCIEELLKYIREMDAVYLKKLEETAKETNG